MQIFSRYSLILWFMVCLILLSACQRITTTEIPLETVSNTPAATQAPAKVEPTPTVQLPATATAVLSPTVMIPSETPLAVLPAGLAPITNCPGAPASRMQVGDQVYVNQALTLNLRLREQPGLAAKILSTNPAGTPFRVVGGPQCMDNFTWWQLESQAGLTGWSAEGETSLMYLLPVGLLAFRDQYQDVQKRQMSRLTVLDTNGNLVKVAVDGFLGAWRLSPDGSQIFFGDSDSQTRGLNAVNLQDGTWSKISNDLAIQLRFSPDGQYLAYYDTSFSFKVMDLTTRETVYQTEFTDVNMSSFAWSPDGRQIALLMDDLRVLDIRSGQWRVLTTITARPERIPGLGLEFLAWSPNGLQLVFNKDHTLALINASGTGEIVLGKSTGNYLFPAWSPDGQDIVFIEEGASTSMGLGELKLFNLASRKFTTLVADMDPFSGVSWSGDGNYLLYVDPMRSVNIYNLANGSQKAITIFSQPGSIPFDPQWVTYR